MLKLKWVGIVSMLAAVLEIVSWALFTEHYSSPKFYVSALFDMIATILLIFTFLGIFLVYRKLPQWFNLLCLIISVLGTSVFAGMKWMHAFVEPFISQAAPELLKADPGPPLMLGINLSYDLFALGILLVGILIIVGKALPKYIGVILVVAIIVDFFNFIGIPLGQPISAIAIFLIGLSLYKQKVELKE